MKYLMGAICAIVLSLAFSGHKCEHVFTQVEQATIKIEQQPTYGSLTLPGSIYSWPTGLQDGKELICVKCFHMQKQVLDYGKPYEPNFVLGSLSTYDLGVSDSNFVYDTCDYALLRPFGSYLKEHDTDSITSTSNGSFFLKGDTLLWREK
jgi:hypothetical protein